MTKDELPTTKSSHEKFRGGKFSVSVDQVSFQDGIEVTREVVHHPGAVAIICQDSDGRWILVRQYRHSVGQMLTEIPAGTRETGESAITTAAREIREETGYSAGRLEHLGGTWMAPGWCTEWIDFLLATELTHSPLPQDFGERIQPPIHMSVEEIREQIRSGVIVDAKTIVAYSLYFLE